MSALIFVLACLWTAVGFFVFLAVTEESTAEAPNFKFLLFSLICGIGAWVVTICMLAFWLQEKTKDPNSAFKKWVSKVAKAIDK